MPPIVPTAAACAALDHTLEYSQRLFEVIR